MIDYDSELNPAQKEAVLYDGGPSLVIAGAGSGKTRVLTYKLAHLIESGYSPHRLMALTFTNKAANEMKERVQLLLGSTQAREMMVGTFHSVFARILRRFAHLLGFNRHFSIYDTSDSKSLIKKIITSLELDPQSYRPAVILKAISHAKNHLISPQEYASDEERLRYDRFNNLEQIRLIYKLYAEACKQANAMDFDDLLYQFSVLLRDFPDALQICQGSIDYLLIDEYQDTNAAQYYIARRLVELSGRIFAVGDDAQSIYSFRGAQISNILLFSKAFANARLFKLEQNYRSTQNIVDLANGLIAKNRDGIPKTLFSQRARGNKAVLCDYESARGEAEGVALSILKRMMRDSSLTYSDFAVLYRTNAQSRLFEEQFRNENIPFRIYGSTAFYDRSEIKNILAYLRVLINPNDNEALRRVLGYPRKGFGKKSIEQLEKIAIEQNGCLYKALKEVSRDPKKGGNALHKRAKLLLDHFAKLQSVEAGNLTEAVQKILTESGILQEMAKDTDTEGVARRENVEEFLSGISEFEESLEELWSENSEDTIPLREKMASFIERISLMTSQEPEPQRDRQDAVTLMTVHASKGLEFEEIYITGMEEGLFPSLQSPFPGDIEEERRLFYVAITRAQNECTISMARTRMINGETQFQIPSSFLKDLDPKLLRIRSARLSWEMASTPRVTKERIGNDPLPTFNLVGRKIDKIPQRAETASESPHRAEERTTKTPQGSISPGTKVKHNRYGNGTVIDIEGYGVDEKVIIRFEDGNIRRIILRFSTLEPIV